MVVTAANATVSNVVGMVSTEAGLSVQTATVKVQWCVSPIDVLPIVYQPFPVFCCLSVSIDQLDKADAPLIPEVYTYLLGVQCLISISDGLAGYTFPLYNTLVVQNHPRAQPSSTEPVHAPGPLDPTTLPETEPARAKLRTNCARMLDAG
jgi:hypothetical protein